MRSYDHVHRLTRAEIEILRLLACGLPHLDIDNIRGTAPNRTRWHNTNLYRKIGVHDQLNAARYAWRNGIISIDEAWEILTAYNKLKPMAEVTYDST